MAGLPGNKAWIGVGKQSPSGQATSGKGVVLTVPQQKNAFSGGNLAMTRNTDRLAETDAARDQGAAYVTSTGVEGSPELYGRAGSLGVYLGAVLGGISAPSLAAPNQTTTFTPTDTLGYYTFWKMIGGKLYEKYADCLVGSLTLSAEAGSPLTATAGIQGIAGRRLDETADASALTAINAVALDQSAPFNFNNATVKLNNNAGTLTPVSNIRSFELTIENNLTAQQTDEVTMYDIAVGTREISLGFDMIFENIDEYTKFHTGTATGTSPASSIFTTAAEFSFVLDANTSVVFSLPSIAYEEFPVDPDPGGDPIVVPVRAVGQRATGVTNLLTAAVKVPTATVADYRTPGT